MKKLIAFLLVISFFCVLHFYTEWRFENDPPRGMLERLEDWFGDLGQTQITDDKDLIGSREVGVDDYVGSYMAECNGSSERDIVFGGASTHERVLRCYGSIQSKEGTAEIRIRLNDEVIILQTDEAGNFETELHLKSGGNYIMVDYSDFTGSVEMFCEYIEEENQAV